jgi:hypothetical protein
MKILSNILFTLGFVLVPSAFGQQVITISPGSSITLTPDISTTVQCSRAGGGGNPGKINYCRCEGLWNGRESIYMTVYFQQKDNSEIIVTDRHKFADEYIESRKKCIAAIHSSAEYAFCYR